jgi:MFS family permease
MHEADETCVEESEQALLDGDTRFAPGTARSALRHKEFRSLFVWAWFSNIGTWMQQIVLAAFAYDLTGSSAFVGQLVFAQLGPVLFLGPIGGVIADLVDRRKLLLIVTFGQIVAAIGLAGVVAADDPSRELMFLAALASGIGFAVFAPAYSAMLPMLVGKEDLPGAIALNSTQMNASRVVGPAIGGLAFATIGPSWVFLANAASYLFVVWALVRVTLPTVPAGEPEPIRRKLLGGIRAARRDPVVGRSLVIITTFSFFSIVYVGMMPVLAADNLGIDEESIGYGIFYACFGLGAALGSIANGTVLASVPKPVLVRRGLLAYAAVVSVLALLGSAPPSYPAVMLVGATYFGMVTALNTMMQSRLLDHERGRVMALWMMGFGGTVAMANLVFGPIVDEIGMTPVMLFGAGVAVVLSRLVREPSSLPVAPA